MILNQGEASHRLLLVDVQKTIDATEDDLLFNHEENCHECNDYIIII